MYEYFNDKPKLNYKQTMRSQTNTMLKLIENNLWGRSLVLNFIFQKKDTCNVLNVQNKLPTMTRLYYICFYSFPPNLDISLTLNLNKTV